MGGAHLPRAAYSEGRLEPFPSSPRPCDTGYTGLYKGGSGCAGWMRAARAGRWVLRLRRNRLGVTLLAGWAWVGEGVDVLGT